MSLNEKLKDMPMEAWPDEIYIEMRLYWPPDAETRNYYTTDYEETIKEYFRRMPGRNRFMSTSKYCGRPIILWFDTDLNSFVVRKKNLAAADFMGQKVIESYSTDSFLAFITYVSGIVDAPSRTKPSSINEIIQWKYKRVAQALEQFNQTLTLIENEMQRQMDNLKQYHAERKGGQ